MQKIFPNEILAVILPKVTFKSDGTFECDTNAILEYAQILYTAAIDAEHGQIPRIRKKYNRVTSLVIQKIIYLWERCPLLEPEEMAKLVDVSWQNFYKNKRLIQLREQYCGKSPRSKN